MGKTNDSIPAPRELPEVKSPPCIGAMEVRKRHIHVYRVSGLVEFDIEGSEDVARAEAVRRATAEQMSLPHEFWGKPDCGFFALEPALPLSQTEGEENEQEETDGL